MSDDKNTSAENKTEGNKAAPEELVEARRQAEEYLNGWKRAKADYANLKKETERDRENLIKFASQELLFELLAVLDNFNAAWAGLKENERNSWTEGIGHIKRQFEEILKAKGIEEIKEDGCPFDAERHEAVGKEKAEGMAANVVLKVVRSGYTLHGKVLRPAQVIVSE